MSKRMVSVICGRYPQVQRSTSLLRWLSRATGLLVHPGDTGALPGGLDDWGAVSGAQLTGSTTVRPASRWVPGGRTADPRRSHDYETDRRGRHRAAAPAAQ